MMCKCMYEHSNSTWFISGYECLHPTQVPCEPFEVGEHIISHLFFPTKCVKAQRNLLKATMNFYYIDFYFSLF